MKSNCNEKLYEVARNAWEFWNKLSEEFISDRYMLLPHLNDEYNKYAFKYLPYYIRKYSINKMVILYLEGENLPPKKYEKTVIWKKISEAEMEGLIKLYGLCFFSEKVTIVSLTKPYETGGERLLGIHGTTKEHLLCYDIYRFDEIPDDKQLSMMSY